MKLTYRRDAEGNLEPHIGSGSRPAPCPPGDEACLAVLRRGTVGRVALVRAGEVSLLPVAYGVDDDGSVVFRTGHGTKRTVAQHGSDPVAFEVDERDPVTGAGTAVVLTGRMVPVLDAGESAHLRRLGVPAWTPGARWGGWVRIRPDTCTGRRVAGVR